MTVGLLALGAVGLVWCLVLIEVSTAPTSTNWPMFAGCALGLLVCERSQAAWIRFGPIGVVTPLWLFAFAMLLVGSASLTVGIATVGATLHALKQVSSPLDTVARVSSTALALASAGLILRVLDATGVSNDLEVVTWEWAGAIGAAGVFMIVVNAFSAAVWLSARRRTSFASLMQHGLASRVTAEGALVSLAPIWVIAVAISPVILPLLGITTVLVFRSTRQALEQSHESLHDQLTGLLNRQAFLDQIDDLLNARLRRGNSFILLMDLDGFKDVNDRLGHQMGDQLLVSFADRLELGRPADAQAARLGGDEFALLVRSSPLEAIEVVEGLYHQLTQPLTLEGFPISIGVSIGVAEAPADGQSTTDLVRAADVAMYKAKRTGLAYATYASCVKSPQHGRLNLLSDLGTALDRNQLHINFQPQLRMSDGSVDTLEALVRWNHPTYGMIPPSEFIGLAEQTDLIEPITELVLRAATQGLMVGGLTERLAVNVSARSLERPDFAVRVFEILGESGFPPEQLELEVTERALVRNAERTSYTLGRLRDAGVRVAIDDFGVGYSSYQTLRVLDVDRVKIDRDFVTGVLASERDRIIVSSLIRLAHDLGLDVVAEGVESTHIWDALVELECDVAQGYGIAVPMTYPEMRRWVSGWTDAVGQPTPPDSDEFVTLRR